MSSLSKFLNDYKFYRIQNSKTTSLIYYSVKTEKHYIKTKEAFIEDIYNIALRNYSTDDDLIEECGSRSRTRKHDESQILYEYLLKFKGINIIEDFKFKPVEQKEFYENELLFFNEYSPTKYLKKSFNNKCDNSKKFPEITELIMNLCAGDSGAYEYFLKVLSHSINNPHIKRHGYIVLQGQGASGKGSLFELVLEPIFKEYFLEEDEAGISGKFNSETYKKIWLVINEKEDGKGFGSLIKRITGSKKQATEAKHQNRKEVEDFRNIIIATNENNPGLELKQDDRRATILGFSKPLGGSKDTAPVVRSRFEKEIPKQLDYFVSYLKNLKFDIADIMTSYETKAREHLINIEKNNTEQFIDELMTFRNSSVYLILEEYKFEAQTLVLIKHRNKDWIKAKDVYKLYELFCNKNDKRKKAENRFFPEFYNTTRLDSKEIKQNGKRLRYIEFSKFLKYFKLNKTPATRTISPDTPDKYYKKKDLERITNNVKIKTKVVPNE